MSQDEMPVLLKVTEAAALLRVSPVTVYRRIKLGEIPAVRVGETGHMRVPRAGLERALFEDPA
jgi:excisionase family DNA binding protein